MEDQISNGEWKEEIFLARQVVLLLTSSTTTLIQVQLCQCGLKDTRAKTKCGQWKINESAFVELFFVENHKARLKNWMI